MIGSGATAIQVVPAVAKVRLQLILFLPVTQIFKNLLRFFLVFLKKRTGISLKKVQYLNVFKVLFQLVKFTK